MTTEVSQKVKSGDRRRFIDAAYYGRFEEVNKLSSKVSNDMKVLNQALKCVGYHLDEVKWLGGHTEANSRKTEERLNKLLKSACHYDHLEIVKYLVETCRADVNLRDSGGYTSLTRACRWVSMPVSMYLLCEVTDLDVNIADRYGNTALHYAVWCSKDAYTQLHWSCGYKHNVTEVRRLVFGRGYRINVQDNAGDTPLHIACSNGYNDIVETLMLAGANETITNDAGKTPAQMVIREHIELLNLLDRDSLWQMMQWRRNKSKFSLVVLMMLIIRLMKQRQVVQGEVIH